MALGAPSKGNHKYRIIHDPSRRNIVAGHFVWLPTDSTKHLAAGMRFEYLRTLCNKAVSR